MKRPRIGVVLAGTAAGLLAIAAAVAGYAVLRSSGGQFADTFDINVRATRPEVAVILAQDQALHDMMLRQTRVAFEAGGWPAASKVFGAIVDREITAYAGDEAAEACDAAWRELARALRGDPRLCRAALTGNRHAARLAGWLEPVDAACRAATVDGGRRRLTTATPDVLGEAEFRASFARIAGAPQPLSAAERAAIQFGAGDDGTFCAAHIKFDANKAALPDGMAARYWRSRYRTAVTSVVGAEVPGTADAVPPAPFCARAGTVFTLSLISARDGRPVTWQSLGQRDWNCRLVSSISGERDMWANGKGNALQRLWPLEVGKAAEVTAVNAGGWTRSTRLLVAEHASFWLPWRRVQGYRIDEDNTLGDGSRYVVSHYWSPELGFQFGQRTRVVKGRWPDDVGPDWQLIAVDAP